MQPDPSWVQKDFYAVLGVSSTATQEELKSAYRRLSKELHPDTNSSPGAEEKFKQVTEAYGVLKDPSKRKAYDALRSPISSPAFGFGLKSGSPYGGFDISDVGFEDLFSDFSSATRRTGFSSPPREILAETSVSFEQAAAGASLDLSSPNGKALRVTLPKAIESGTVLRVKPGPGESDILLTVTVKPHPWFHRDGLDLHLDLPVTFDELALGATVTAPTFPSGEVRVKIPAGTPNGRVLKVRARGLQDERGAKGDLLLTVRVEVPKSLPPEAIEAVEAYRAATEIHQPRGKFFAE